MALAQERQRRVAQAIIRAVHECDAGMKVGAGHYRNAQSQEEAIGLLKRAARLPYRVEARVAALVAKHGAAKINQALALVSTLTLADLQAELAPLKVYSDELKDKYQNQGWTLEQIAADIEATRADIDHDENAQIPPGYIDEF